MKIRVQVGPLKSGIPWPGTSLVCHMATSSHGTIPVLKINYPVFLVIYHLLFLIHIPLYQYFKIVYKPTYALMAYLGILVP